MRTCEFPGCGKQFKSGGLCSGHLTQRRNGKQLTPLRLRIVLPAATGCKAQGCGRKLRARGLCNTHYIRWYSGRVDWDRPIGGYRRGYLTLCCESPGRKCLTLPKASIEALRQKAEARGMSVFDYVRDLLERHCQETPFIGDFEEVAPYVPGRRSGTAGARRQTP